MFRVISRVVPARYRLLREEHVRAGLLTLSRLRPAVAGAFFPRRRESSGVAPLVHGIFRLWLFSIPTVLVVRSLLEPAVFNFPAKICFTSGTIDSAYASARTRDSTTRSDLRLVDLLVIFARIFTRLTF